jgi:hypothetical protein
MLSPATLRLRFPGGSLNEYRLQENGVEFLTSNGTWRVLEEPDMQFHVVLHTEVARWLLRHSVNANPHPLHTR